jgi:predicted MFS family arabinose efflux permease
MASYALPTNPEQSVSPLSWAALAPVGADYQRAFAMLGTPAVALIVAATFLWISVLSIQGSFYTVYLQGIGMSGTLIGLLVGIKAVIGGPAALITGAAEKFVPAHYLLLLSIAVALVSMTLTPLLTSFMSLLLVACIFGIAIGFGFPLLLSMVSSSGEGDDHGLRVGLRTTANRLASIVMPAAMGLVIELVGIRMGFIVIGIALCAILMLVAWTVHRSPAFRLKRD